MRHTIFIIYSWLLNNIINWNLKINCKLKKNNIIKILIINQIVITKFQYRWKCINLGLLCKYLYLNSLLSMNIGFEISY